MRVYLSKIKADSDSEALVGFERVLDVESKPTGYSRVLHHTVLLGRDQTVVFLLACPLEHGRVNRSIVLISNNKVISRR